MTYNQTVQSVTANYLNSHTFNTMDEISKIEGDILEEINAKFDEHNLVASKDEKWRKLQTLLPAQIADIVNAVFNVKLINFTEECNREDTTMGTYVDDLILNIIPSLDGKQGTYSISEDVPKLLAKFFNYNMSKKEMADFIEALQNESPVVTRCFEVDTIPLANGLFNYKTKQLEPFTPEKVFTAKSQVAYNPNAKNVVIHNSDDGTDWDVESWMKSLAPIHPEIAETLWEITGALLRPNVRWNKAAFLYSDTGNNGKGTLAELYRSILGKGSHASIPLGDFGKQFALAPLLTSVAVVTDENDVGQFVDKAGNLKSIITNDVIQVERKFLPSVAYQFRGFMVQCLNEYPRIKDKSDSFFRRQLFIPMEACFTQTERRYIKTDYLHRQEVLEYIVKRVLEMDYYTLSEPDACKDALKEFRELNDPIIVFWEEMRDKFSWSLLPFKFLYSLYKVWFKENKPNGLVGGSREFTNEIVKAVANDSEWYCDDKTFQVTVNKNNMGSPEHLIYEYNLTEWMSSYRGADIDKICTPDKLSQKYAGIQRYAAKEVSDNE